MYEIIIIDSGKDNTREYIKQLCKENNNFIKYKKVKHCTNRSLLRNKGAKLAHGDLLIFLDNDILVSPDFIETITKLHGNNEKTIVLGKRKSLTNFDINFFGKENLINNFSILNNLPSIRDDRELYLDDINLTIETAEKPWRFLFSHSFCISKSTYFEVGGFDKKFGNKWGCEDIELGYRLFYNNCKFILSNEIVSFHQPHFSQSKKEQKECSTNNDFFIKKHPYVDAELNLTLFKYFQEDYLELKSLKTKTNFLYINDFNGFDYILGCIKEINDNIEWPKHCFLGTYIPVYKKCKKVLILKTINKMNYRIKLSIISEGFRVSDNVWFEKEKDEYLLKKQLRDLLEDFKRIGLNVTILEELNYYKITLNNKIKTKYLTLFLCDIYNYEKRLVYLYLAEKFRSKNWKVNVVDLRRKQNEYGEDFILDTKSSFEDYSYCVNSSIISSLNNKTEKLLPIISGNESYTIDDVDFPYSIQEQNICIGTNRLDKTIFDIFAINAAFEKVNEYKKRSNKIIKPEFDICTFMANGYYEDGIDVILESIKNNKTNNIKLSIKIPDYETIIEECYPGHNLYSKKYKLSTLFDKKIKEEHLLKSKILEMDLYKNVNIIKQNMTVFEIFDFMLNSKVFVLLNRGFSVHFLIYSSLFLNQVPIVTEHSVIDERLKKYCFCVKTQESSYAYEKHLAISSENILRLAQKIDSNSFNELLTVKNNKVNKSINLQELDKIAKEYTERMNNFLINI